MACLEDLCDIPARACSTRKDPPRGSPPLHREGPAAPSADPRGTRSRGSAANTEVREYTAADAFGNFDLKLPAGDWYVYLGNGDGRANFHKKVSLGDADARDFKVVSR